MNDPILDRLDTLPDDIRIIVDLGANTGREIPHLQRRWPEAMIVACEPNLEPYRQLVKIPGIYTMPCAVGARAGTELLYPSTTRGGRAHNGSSSLRQPKDHLVINPDVAFGKPFPVRVRTLDFVCEWFRIERIDLLWMDVQGCEGDVIRGGEASIAKTRFIYTESYEQEMYDGQTRRPDLLAMLPDFEQVALDDPYNILLRRR